MPALFPPPAATPLLRSYVSGVQFDPNPAYNEFLRTGQCREVCIRPSIGAHLLPLPPDCQQLDVKLVLDIHEAHPWRESDFTPLSWAVTVTGILFLPDTTASQARADQLLAASEYLAARAWEHLLYLLGASGVSLAAPPLRKRAGRRRMAGRSGRRHRCQPRRANPPRRPATNQPATLPR